MKIYTVNLFTLICLFFFIQNIDAQCPAGMAADAGTSTMNIPVGGTPGGGPYVLCFNDEISISSNNDYVLPPAFNNPGVVWMFYFCQPTLEDIANDPCYASGGWSGQDYNEFNDGGTVAFLGNVNHFWVAPAAIDGITAGGLSIDGNNDDCYDVNLTEAYEIYFLNEIQFSATNDDCNGTSTVTITGGYPEFFAGTYTVSNTGPGTLTQSGVSGETITVTGLADGQSCSFDITDDGNGCTDNFFGSPINLNMDDPTFTFDAFCIGETNGPTGIAMAGGTFAFNPPAADGATIDPNTGMISNAVAGNSYTVEYTVGVCMQTSTVNVTPITLPPAPTINPNMVTLCPGDNTLISPSGVGSNFNFYANQPPGTPLISSSVFDPTASLVVGLNTFYVTETVGTCEGPATSVEITLLDVLTPPTLNPDNLSVCLGASVSITPSANNGEANPVFNFYGDAALSNLLSTGTDYTFTANNDTQIWVTEEINPCESNAVIFTLTIAPPPTQLVINDEMICLNDAVPDVSAAGSGGTINWYNNDPSGGGVPSIATGNPFSPPVNSGIIATTTFWVTETNAAGCESIPTAFNIIVEASPVAPNSTSPSTICVGDVIPNLTANGGGGTLNWYDNDPSIGNPPIIGSGSPFSPAINSNVAGIFDFWVTETNANSCEGIAIQVSITIESAPSPPTVVQPNPICLDDAPPSVTANGSGGTINWYDSDPAIGNPAPIGSGSPFMPLVNTSIAGNIPIWITETSATGCESTATTFNIIVEAPPVIPNAVSPATICVGDPIPNLTANGTGGTLNWYDSDPSIGNPPIIGSGSPFSPAINSNFAATFNFWVSETSANNCEGAANQVSIIVEDAPAAPTVAQPNPVCLNAVPPTLTANGAGGIITWYDSDPAVGNPIPIGAGSPFMPIINTNIAGTTTLWVTETNNNNCESIAAMVLITVNAPPPAPITNPIILICVNDPTPSLFANGVGGTIFWYNTDPTIGSPAPIGIGSPFVPIINTSSAGNFFIWVTEQDAAGCESSASQISITISPLPVLADVQLDCSADLLSYTAVITFTVTDNISVSEGTVTDNGGGSFTISGIDINNNLTITANNSVSSCSDNFTITAPDCNCPTVDAPINGGDMAICNGDVLPTLSVTVGAGETVNWYDAATGGTLLAANTTTFTPTAAGTYFAETEITSSGCTSLTRTAVMLTINPLPTLSSTQTDCSADLQTYTATIIFTNATDLTISEGTLTDNGSGSFTISGIDVNNDLTVTASNTTTSCFDDFIITAPDCNCPTVNAPVSGGDAEVCEGDAFPTLSTTVGADETVDWYDAATGGILLAGNMATFTPIAAGTYFAETREISSGCNSSTRTAVMLIINPLPTLSSTQTDCSADLLMYTATLVFANTSNISISEGTLVDNGSGSFTISDIDINNDLIVTANNSTTSCTDDFIITAPDCNCPTVNAPISGGDAEICEGDAFPTLSATVGIGETIDWYDAAVDGTLLASDITTFTPSAAGTYFAETREISSDCTSSTRTSITLSINPLPILNSTETDCSADLQTYTATLVFANTSNIIISEGTLIDNGGGSFIISGIDINNVLSVTANNVTTTCSDGFTIPAPNCNCPTVDPPVSGGDAEICEGDVLPTLNATVEIGETVDWYDAALDGTLLASGTTTFTPSTAGTYFAETRVINSGCTSLTRTAVTLTVNANPVLSVTDLSHPGCGLSNGSITLNASGGQTPYIYQMGNNPPQNSPIFMPLAAATYSFSVQDDNGCISTAIDTILVEPLGPTAVISGLDTLTCALTTFQLDAAASSGDGGLNFEWIYNNETIADDIILSVSEPGMYILIVHQDACMDSDTVFVEEILASNIIADIQSETALDCNISSVILDGTGSSLGTNITYAWFFNNSLIPGEENNTYQANITGLYTIQVTDNTTGCIVTDEYNLIDNNAFPVANAGEDGVLNCITENTLLDGSTSQLGTSIVFQWLLNDETIPNATTNTWTVSLPGTYTLEVRDTTNGCANEDIVLVTTDYTLPTVEAGEDNNLGCQEESLSLNGEGSAVGTQFSYNWSTGNNGTILSGANTLSPTIGSAGQYWLTVTNTENGCTASDSTTVGQIESIQTNISVTTENVGCFGESNGSITLEVEDPAAQIVYAINQADFVTNANFFNLEAGAYDIIAEDVNGCQWDTTIVIEAGIEMLVDLGEDHYIHLGDSVQLNGLINISEDDVASIKWTNSNLLHCLDCLNPYTFPLQFTTSFELTVSDQSGCSDSDIITVYVDKTRNVFIPNAFSPNGDGINDFLIINSDNDVENVKQFSIFDRWGEILFEASNFQPNSLIYGWDGNYRGKPLNAGVYIYFVEIDFLDGKTEIFSGDVILMR